MRAGTWHIWQRELAHKRHLLKSAAESLAAPFLNMNVGEEQIPLELVQLGGPAPPTINLRPQERWDRRVVIGQVSVASKN